MRSANGLALALTLLAASTLMLLTRFPYRRGALLTGGLGAVALAGWVVVSTALHLPGLNETIQDFASVHFRRPDIPDPYTWLYHKNLMFWPRQGTEKILTSPWPVFAFLLSRADPLPQASPDRLGVAHLGGQRADPAGRTPSLRRVRPPDGPLWLTVSCALGWAAALALSWRPGPVADATPAPTPPAPAPPAVVPQPEAKAALL